MKNGTKIYIDEMSIEHLRNTLKMIVRQSQSIQKTCPHNIEQAFDMQNIEEESNLAIDICFSDKEIKKLTHKTQYENDNLENLWK